MGLGTLRRFFSQGFVTSSTAEMLHPKDAIEAGAEGVIDKLDPPERVFAAMRGE